MKPEEKGSSRFRSLAESIFVRWNGWQSWLLVGIPILLFDLAISIFVIQRVPYTEIDWSTYMQQVELFMNGERMYNRIEGDTGPVVYPAGFIYLYSFFHSITNGGKNIWLAQYIFAGISFLTNFAFVILHSRSTKVPPFAAALIVFSRRTKSIYVLRLFNDGVAMAIMGWAAVGLVHGWGTLSAILFSLALSVKMNILLFAPGYALMYLQRFGWARSVLDGGLAMAIQIILSLPFTLPSSAHAAAYVSSAFDFSRMFLHVWTVNWKFVPEDLFTSRQFARILLVLHVAMLAIAFVRSQKLRASSVERQTFLAKWGLTKLATLSADDIVSGLFLSNFLGIVCARSLHFQFLSWFSPTLPYLLWRTRYPTILRVSIWLLNEWVWNQFPSTPSTSIILQLVHFVILAGL
ncbi:asparagine-linked glycosylation 3 [Cladochytrium replicatum]|nr:asparagine-linked glycosylation 3 [Cladochytrium replicatum]